MADASSFGRQISYRVSLLVAVPLLVAVTGGGIAARTYLLINDTLSAVANDLFRQVSRQAVAATRADLERAVPTSDEIRLALLDGSLGTDPAKVERRFVEALRVNPEFSWVSYSETDGSFTGAFHAGAGYRVNHSTIHDGRTELFEHDVGDGGELVLRRHVDDSGYDPRTRPFWRLAEAQRHRAWTEPYVFYDQSVPGITCATPVIDRTGTLRGVITIDFDLNRLSAAVADLAVTPNAKVFIYTPDGTVIAHPTVHLVEKVGQADKGRLVTTADIADPVARDYAAAAQRFGAGVRAAEEPRFLRFESAGRRYLGSYASFAVDRDLYWVAAVYAPESDFLASAQRYNVVSLWISLGALGLAILFSLILANRIAVPLSRLAGEMERVGGLDLDGAAMPPSMFREIAMMNVALHRMKHGLRAFASYVPRDLVRALLASGQGARLGGRISDLTVFFSDIAGFTSIAEEMKPGELVELLGAYLDEMTQAIGQEKGTVDKYIGDGIMAFWGAPATVEDHAARACLAALDCSRRMARLSRAEGGAWARKLHTRIGIATGDVLVGNIGTKDRMNYTVMGDTANLASRLEGLNKVYGTSILASEATVRAAGSRIVARPVDVVAVKGKAQETRVYEVLACGDEDAVADRALAALCERALAAYLARDFMGAAGLWDEALAAMPGDPVSRVMAERARANVVVPPPAAWTGVHVVDTK